MAERYDEYDSFAAAYNRHWGFFADAVLPILDRLGFDELAPGSRILDLCCGTGQLAAALTARGHDVVGVDGSARMIDVARRNAPDAEFLVADARTFRIEGTVNAAVSTFDSLNHVLTIEELERVFANVAAAVEPGGRFYFDLNTEEGFIARWQETTAITADDEIIIVVATYDEASRIGSNHITLLVPEGDLWRRSDTTLTQAAHMPESVATALRAGGFSNIEIHDSQRDLALRTPGRAFFVATRSDG